MLTKEQIEKRAIEHYTAQFPPNPEEYVDRDFEDGAIWASEQLTPEIERLQAENARLREAIQTFVALIDTARSEPPSYIVAAWKDLKAALAQQ